MTQTGTRGIAIGAVRKIHSTLIMAVSDQAGLAERELWNIGVVPVTPL
jgi:hypothetical protein